MGIISDISGENHRINSEDLLEEEIENFNGNTNVNLGNDVTQPEVSMYTKRVSIQQISDEVDNLAMLEKIQKKRKKKI